MPDADAMQTGALALAGLWGLKKVAGPTLDMLGSEISDFVQRRIENLKRIGEAGARKVRGSGKGQVNARVLKDVVTDGSLVEDELAAEYFGGVLASSRSEDGQDDTSLPLMGLIKRLSAHQLRLHYAIYWNLNRLYSESSESAEIVKILTLGYKRGVFIPDPTIRKLMGPKRDELTGLKLLEHMVYGLQREGLVYRTGVFRNDLVPRGRLVFKAENPGLIASATNHGIELFMAAYGYAREPLYRFLDRELEFEQWPGLGYISEGVVMMTYPDKYAGSVDDAEPEPPTTIVASPPDPS
jgi:hypothetical protein